jgi:hypothetical protein
MIHYAPTKSQRSPWLIGKDKAGRWIVRDQAGLNGGIFSDRIAALHFVLMENGTEAAIMVPGTVSLDMAPLAKQRQ